MSVTDVVAARSQSGDTEPRLATAVAAFRRWLYLPDPGPLYVIAGAVAANRMAGDPVWLLVVAAPGAGKTELLNALTRQRDVHTAATITEAALLSGTPKKEVANGSKGGLLRQIGDFGIVVAKDFGSVLSMHREARAAVLAALREIYDGSWTRHVGADGGRTLHWEGKVGVIAGCTPAIDSHHAVIGTMGERFAMYRLSVEDEAKQAECALRHAGREAEMREDLAGAVSTLFAGAGLAAGDLLPRPVLALEGDEGQRLVELARLAVRCRSAVERDPYRRDIELIPEPEAPGRLALVLARLRAGMRAIGVGDDEAWRLVVKVALDSMPALRRKVVDLLVALEQPTTTSAVATTAGYPTTTASRALEDLAAHGVVTRASQGSGRADLWSLSSWARQRWQAVTSPETSGRTA